MALWVAIMGILFSIQSLVSRPDDLSNVLAIWIMAISAIAALEIVERYFSHITFYFDGDFRVTTWFIPKARTSPSNIQEIGFVSRALNKVYKELYIVYRNKAGKKEEFTFSIASYGSYYIAQFINNIVTINKQVELDEYCQDLADKYRNTPKELEKNVQDKFDIRLPFPQWFSDILMFLLLILCLYIFFRAAI